MTAQVQRWYVTYVVFLLFLVNGVNYGQRMIVSLLLPSIKADVKLSDGELGVMMGGGFALFYALAGVPLARLADRHVRRTFLAGALFFWSTATALFGMTQNFAQMLGARVALGVGESVSIPTSHSLLGDYVAPENRPFVFGLHSTGGVVGVTLTLILGGYLGALVGWRNAMWLTAIPGFVLAAALVLTVREPLRETTQGAQAPLREILGHLIGVKFYGFVLLAICLSVLVEFGLNQWLPSYYVRRFGLSVAEVGLRYGLAVAIGGIPGSVLGGLAANRLGQADVRWLVWLPAALYGTAIPLGLAMLLVGSAHTALILNGAYSFAIFATNGPIWAACFWSVPAMMRATVSAVTLLVSGVTGLALGPMLVGGISEALSARAGSSSLQISLLFVECLASGVIVALLIASRYMKSAAASGKPATPSGRPGALPASFADSNAP